MQLIDQGLLIRHCIQVAVQAIDDDHFRSVSFHALPDQVGEFAGGHFRRINLPQPDLACVNAFFESDAQRQRACFQGSQAFVERKNARMIPALGGSDCVLNRDGGFSGARRTQQQRAGTSFRSSAEQGIESGNPAFYASLRERFAVFRRNQPRMDQQSAALD